MSQRNFFPRNKLWLFLIGGGFCLLLVIVLMVGYQEIMQRRLVDEIINDKLQNEVNTQLQFRLVNNSPKEIKELTVYHYDYNYLQQITTKYQNISRQYFLQTLFSRITENTASEKEKWLLFSDFISSTMFHDSITQPMYHDRCMVSDPLLLLVLGEGRCSHVARVIVDTALANGYEARLVHVAAHFVAEVKYNGKWHWIDADIGFPKSALNNYFKNEIPSVIELAKNPRILDHFPARNWVYGTNYKRTLDSRVIPSISMVYYPGEITTSSRYFGQEIFNNSFKVQQQVRGPYIEYYYKKGSSKEWQAERSYGWKNFKMEKQEIVPVTVQYDRTPVTVISDSMFFNESNEKILPLKWNVAKNIQCDEKDAQHCHLMSDKNLRYQVCVSSQSRGWDYDFRNYKFMPEKGKCDLTNTTKNINCDNSFCSIDLDLSRFPQTTFYIEIDPKPINDLVFQWPSNELVISQWYPNI